MNQLLLHPQTRTKVISYISRPSHALIIVGQPGSGKKTLAKNVAIKLLNLTSESALETYPYFSRLARPADKQEIPIDSVRQLINQLKLRTTGRGAIRRVVLIENAQDMSAEAQNALLKILEEPAEDTSFILTASSHRAVLPTITSRAQSIHVQPVTSIATHQYFAQQVPASEVEKAWLLSGGTAGLLSALLLEEQIHPLKTAVNDIKSWLGQDLYQRLVTVDKISRNKADFDMFIVALDKVLRVLQFQQVAKDKTVKTAQILQIRRRVEELRQALGDNVQPRLIALELAATAQL